MSDDAAGGPGSPWPKEREERLLELAPSAHWVGEIALALGVSKNAVIGKMARMRRKGHVIATDFDGRTGRPPSIAIGSSPRRPPLPRPVAHAMTTPPKPRRGLPPPDPVRPEPALDVLTMRRLDLMQLRKGTCRWPIGDVGEPGFCFCGNPTAADRMYCPVHYAVAHYRGNR
jgi:GcrA cell cycle regulator